MNLSEQPDRQNLILVDVLYALGDPVRLNMVYQLANQGELPCAGLCTESDRQVNDVSPFSDFAILWSDQLSQKRHAVAEYAAPGRFERTISRLARSSAS
jgi:hypothetical protein